MFSKNFDQYIYLDLDNSEEKKIFEKDSWFDDVLNAPYFL
jgi:hypothetical protein